jgi:hypothetical protein
MPHDQRSPESTRGQPGIYVPLTYRAQWEDGFGAHGWKLDIAVDDRRVIACTSYTGHKSPTSVLVHDILDHLVSGFPQSGYRNEAVATTLHGLRNGIEFQSSFEWMVDEIVAADDLDESILPFLSPAAANLLTSGTELGLHQKNQLLDRLGKEALRKVLLAGFFRVGLEGIPQAIQQWTNQGLDFSRMRAIGFALQVLLRRADAYVSEQKIQYAQARFFLSNDACDLSVTDSCTLTEPVS